MKTTPRKHKKHERGSKLTDKLTFRDYLEIAAVLITLVQLLVDIFRH
jgi:hypothetical protein